MLAAEPQLGRCEQPVDDHVVAAHPVVHQFGAALRADHPKRRHFALADPGREFDEHLPSVIKGPQRPPGRIIAFDPVAEIQRADIDAGRDRGARIGGGVLPAECDELILRIGPGDRGPCRFLGRAEFEVIGPPVGVITRLVTRSGRVGLTRI